MERDEVLSHLRERIVAFAASRMGRDSAEDLAQEVLMILEEKYGHVGQMEELVPLSFQILRFKMTAARRKSVRRGEPGQLSIDELQIAGLGPSPEVHAERRELLDRMLRAIPQTGERCRELFRLKLLGRTFAEIRTELKAESINTLYTWDLRCRKHLEELMRK